MQLAQRRALETTRARRCILTQRVHIAREQGVVMSTCDGVRRDVQAPGDVASRRARL
jgi:hypothetical protein